MPSFCSAAPCPCMHSLPPLLPGHLHLSRAQGAGCSLETIFPTPPGCRWLNTLGLLASQGIDVVVRHSFLDHGHNHLVDQNFNPLPVGLPGGARRDAPFSLMFFLGEGGSGFSLPCAQKDVLPLSPTPLADAWLHHRKIQGTAEDPPLLVACLNSARK